MPTTYYRDQTDLRAMMHFTASAAFELLLSLKAVQKPPTRLQGWADRARTLLGPACLEEARFFYEELWHPLAVMELPVDYAGPPDDAEAFIAYIESLDPESFLFYLWGRLIPRHEIAALRAMPERVGRQLRVQNAAFWPGKSAQADHNAGLIQSAQEPEILQRRLVTLLRAFNTLVFHPELADLRGRWTTSIAEQEAILAQIDPAVFVQRLSCGRALPPMFPAETPLREIRLVPSCYVGTIGLEVWGYGTVVILYDVGLNVAREQELDRAARQLSPAHTALADPTRLKILRAISQDPELYGHKLARLFGISQPAISRHMGILKRGGLVDEVPSEGRVLYRLRRTTLENLWPALRNYLDE